MMRTWIFVAMLFSMLGLVAEASAQYGTGTSSIVLSQSSVNLSPGASAFVNYTVQLASGSTWGTTISASNSSFLQSKGISLSFSKSYAEPTFSGVLTLSASASAAAGTYTVSLSATGDDPTTSPTQLTLVVGSPATTTTTITPTTTTAPTTTAALLAPIAKTTASINASSGGTVRLDSTIAAIIPAGTYAMVNGTKLAAYNFSIIDFSVSSNFPSPNATLAPYGAYAFAVNGNISPAIEFVNASGSPQAVKSIVVGGQNDTSWTWLGGIWNGSYYTGGKYAFADSWTHPNSTAMVNNVFYKPVVWVFEAPAAAPASTTAPSTTVPYTTTVPSSTTPYNSGATYAAIAVVVILIVAAIAYFLFRKR